MTKDPNTQGTPKNEIPTEQRASLSHIFHASASAGPMRCPSAAAHLKTCSGVSATVALFREWIIPALGTSPPDLQRAANPKAAAGSALYPQFWEEKCATRLFPKDSCGATVLDAPAEGALSDRPAGHSLSGDGWRRRLGGGASRAKAVSRSRLPPHSTLLPLHSWICGWVGRRCPASNGKMCRSIFRKVQNVWTSGEWAEQAATVLALASLRRFGWAEGMEVMVREEG